MVVSLPAVREQLARLQAGELLSPVELAELRRSARILRRRLDRLAALHPGAFGVELHAQLDELAQPPVLSGSA